MKCKNCEILLSQMNKDKAHIKELGEGIEFILKNPDLPVHICCALEELIEKERV